MLSENIILQSAGSLSVAVLALLMMILQALFFFRKPQFTWCAWSAAGSFAALLYSVGIFLEYNTPEGPLNRFSGLLEFTAIICLVHCLYGFTFSYIGMESKRYHAVAGVCHGLILILLWFTNYVVADSFTTRDFIGLKSPYIEPALGPLGPLFMLYVTVAGVNALIIWIKHKRTDPKLRIIYAAGMGFWILLGIHDGLATLGLPTLQYFMEYGFLGFTMAILWVVFNKYLEIAAEEKHRVITEFANDCILIIQDGKVVFGNSACCDWIGGPLTHSEPRDFSDIIMSEDLRTALEDCNTLLEGSNRPHSRTVRIRGADGEPTFVEITSSLIQYRNRPAVLAIMRDITEQKRVEQVLRESEEQYRTLVDNLPVAVYRNTPGPEGQFLMANPAFCKMFGFKNEEEVKDFTPASLYQNSKERKEYSDNLIQKGLINNDERTLLKRDGTPVYTSIISRVVYRKDGEISHFDSIILDITDRKRAEEILRESEEKFRSMMEAMSDSVYICSSDFRVVYMNPSMIKTIGHDATGELCHKALFDKDGQCPWCLHDKVQQGESVEAEIVSPRDNRSYHVIHSPIFHKDGSISKMTIYSDTTETKQLQDQLFRSERLSATGQLAATITHEINSPLQAITSILHSIERTHDQDEKLLEKLNLVTSGFVNIRDIVRKLLDLNRPGKEKKQSMNVNSVIEDTVALLKNYLKTNNIKIVLNLSSGIPSITASPQQLGQVFMNLISNAVEAMTGTSKSKADWKTRETIDGEITVNSDLGKDTITINVADTGPGISKEDLEHIFDPFYTRKKEMGIGIGLSLCHGIIEDHKGFITAKNSPEGGAVFTITLPIR